MSLFFDGLIFSFLLIAGIGVVYYTISFKQSKTKAFNLGMALFLLIAWIVIFYGSFFASRQLIVVEDALALSENGRHEMKVVIVGDIHAGPYKKTGWVEKVVELVNEQSPDLVLLTGDFVYDKASQVEYLTPLTQLSPRFGTYAVTGNHDYRSDEIGVVIKALESFGVEVLENEWILLDQEHQLKLVGVSDLWFEADFERAFEEIEDEGLTLLLSHNPDAVLYSAAWKADGIISGHTHGGQIRLPIIGSVPRIPDLLGRAYDKGLFTYKDQWLLITAGVGETGPRARLFNPPEINVLKLSY